MIHFTVVVPVRHVVAIVEQQHQVIIRGLLGLHGLRRVTKLGLHIGNSLLEEQAHGFLISQRGIAQAGQQLMLWTLGNLLTGEVHGQQVLSRCPGQAPLEDCHVLLVFLLGHGADGLGKARDYPVRHRKYSTRTAAWGCGGQGSADA